MIKSFVAGGGRINPPDCGLDSSEIISNWSGDHPLVSIQCVAYNHVDYIKGALNSFLMQKTDFPFEIWVHDDASTDGTQDIIKDYANRYPDIVKIILQTENKYSQGQRALGFFQGIKMGKYIAFCEADDFWRDPFKLQKQVDYLESHPECVITGHDAICIDESGRVLKESKLPGYHQRDYTNIELLEGKAWILTMSWVYRNVVDEFAPERNNVRNGDTFFTSILGQYGGSHFHRDIEPAAYRMHDGGVWSRLSANSKIEESTNTLFWMYRYYNRIGKHDIAEIFRERYLKMSLKSASLMALMREILTRIPGVKVARRLLISVFKAR